MRDRNSSRSCNGPFGLSCGGARLSLRSHAAKMSKPVSWSSPSVAQTDSKPIELVLPFRQCTPTQ